MHFHKYLLTARIVQLESMFTGNLNELVVVDTFSTWLQDLKFMLNSVLLIL